MHFKDLACSAFPIKLFVLDRFSSWKRDICFKLLEKPAQALA